MALPQWEGVLRLLVAAALGSLIGLERQRLGWAAGLRTHMLVCVGSCLIMIVSAYGFSTTLRDHVVLDPSRVAAQVVSGIGFLGAGSIIFRNQAIKGLTTAASIWTVAGVGLATGGGLYTAAIATTLIILAILAGLKPFEGRLHRALAPVSLVVAAKRGTVSMDLLQGVLGLRGAAIRQLIVERDEAGAEVARLKLLRMSPVQATAFADALRVLPGVREVRIEQAEADH